jgi:hypothetical protein
VRRSYSGNSLKDQTGAESEAQVVERRTRLQKTKSRVLKNLKWWFIGLPVYFVGLMYAVKALVYIWDPATASFLKHQYILFVGILSGLIYSISIAFILSEWLKAEDRRVRLKGLIVTICVMFIVYIASVGYYSYSLYPQLPNGLGGGQPTPIILWIDKEDFPVDLQKRFPNATFSSDDKITKCEKLYLLYSNSDTLILTDGSNQAPGVLLKRDDIKAIAW